MQQVVVTLAQNLELENQALLERDGACSPPIDHGDRLVEMQARLRGRPAARRWSTSASTRISVGLLVPFGRQDGLSLGLR